MRSLTFVGLGLGALGVSLEGIEEIRKSDVLYLENYTTPHDPNLLKELEAASGKTAVVVDRGFVEDGRKLLEEAKTKAVVLAVPGDPMIATTHGDLRVRAIRSGIATKVVHGATIAAAVASASGLHFYKFSRAITVTNEGKKNPAQVYRVLHRNLLEGAHTLLLLEHDQSTGEGVEPGAVLEGLLNAEENFKRGVVSDDSYALVLCRVGREDALYAAGTFSELIGKGFGEPPYSVVIPGKLHFTEVESISAVFGVSEKSVRDNSASIRRTAQTLVPKYLAKARKALEQVREELDSRYDAVVENAELYMKDAEAFLAKGEDELAMLSIGYAEGLLDSLGFGGVVKIDW